MANSTPTSIEAPVRMILRILQTEQRNLGLPMGLWQRRSKHQLQKTRKPKVLNPHKENINAYGHERVEKEASPGPPASDHTETHGDHTK